MPELDINKIKEFLPHRYPFLLVDRVLDYEPGKSLVAIKNISFNEPCFQGHFPDNPIFPGVLTLEAMAQAVALLGFISPEGLHKDSPQSYYLVGVDKARFKSIIYPGDQMKLNVKYLRSKGGIAKFTVQVTVDDKLIASAEIMTAIVDV